MNPPNLVSFKRHLNTKLNHRKKMYNARSTSYWHTELRKIEVALQVLCEYEEKANAG